MNQQITPALVKQLRDRTGIGLSKCKEALEEAKGDIELAISNLRKLGMAQAVKKEGRETKEGIIRLFDNGKAVGLVEVSAETDFVVRNEKFQTFAEDLAQEVCALAPVTLEEFLKQKSSKDPKLSIDEYRSILVQTLGENIQIKRVELFPKKPQTSLGIYSHMGGKLVSIVEIQGSEAMSELAKEIAMHIAAESPEYLSSEEVPARIIQHEKEIASAQVKGKPANIIDKIVEGKLKAYFEQVCLLYQRFVKDPSITIEQLVEKKGKEISKPLHITQFLRWKVGE